jgi:hypothetical protein
MKAVIDRIENSYAVVSIEGVGVINIPVRCFGFAVHEGQHLKITWSPDKKSEKQTLEAVKNLQKVLKRRKK